MLALRCKIVTGLTLFRTTCSAESRFTFDLTTKSQDQMFDVNYVSYSGGDAGALPVPIIRNAHYYALSNAWDPAGAQKFNAQSLNRHA